MPKTPVVINGPEASRNFEEYDGEMAYLQELQKYSTRMSELQKRLRLSNDSLDSRAADKLRTDLGATKQTSKDLVNETSEALKKKIADLHEVRQQLHADSYEVDKHDPIAMGLEEKQAKSSTDFLNFNEALMTTIPNFDRTEHP